MCYCVACKKEYKFCEYYERDIACCLSIEGGAVSCPLHSINAGKGNTLHRKDEKNVFPGVAGAILSGKALSMHVPASNLFLRTPHFRSRKPPSPSPILFLRIISQIYSGKFPHSNLYAYLCIINISGGLTMVYIYEYPFS